MPNPADHTFRPGDRVRGIVATIIDWSSRKNECGQGREGYVGIIVKYGEDSRPPQLWYWVRWDGFIGDEGCWEGCIEPIKPPTEFERRVHSYIIQELRRG